MEMVEIDPDELKELRHKAGAYENARDNKRTAQAELAVAHNKIAELEVDRDKWKSHAESWYDQLRYMHPEHFDNEGRWLNKPRKTKSPSKAHRAQDNDIVPGLKSDENVAPEPTNTQVIAPVKVAKAPRKKSMTWIKSRVKTFMSDLDN